MSKRFLVLTDEDLDDKTKKSKNDNTLKCEQRADKAFKNFLLANGCDENNLDYWNFSEPNLDKYLSKFWFSARKNIVSDEENITNEQDPELKQQFYKANSLRNFCYSLNRILKTKGHLYDITDKRTASFQKSQQAFIDAMKELKEHGKAEVESYPEIEETDRVKMYTSAYLSPNNTNRSLQRKVQFDIRFFFAHRGYENMEKMTKQTFKFAFNSKSEMWYVYKDQDELTKNHKTMEEKITGFMPESKDDPLCPVASFRKYLEHLNPENNYLWQMPLDKINLETTKIWYERQHLRKHTLGNFMQDVSKECHLSKKYTNHSIRVTGVTVLTRQNIAASEIMSITGHKSVPSLTIYQRSQDLQKITIGNVMHQALTQEEENIFVPRRSIQLQNEAHPLPQAGNVNFNVVSPRKAMAPISFNQPIMPEKPNATNELVPFEANLRTSMTSI